LSVERVYVAYRGNVSASYWQAMAELSPRQREILDLVAAGRTSKEIAGELGISESTVNWHISNAFGRLGASSRAEAVALAIEADQEIGDETQGESDLAPKSPRRPPMRRPSAGRPSAGRPSVPLLSIVFVSLTLLLLALLGGALIAGWHVMVTPPSSTPVPTGTSAPSVAPTARPSGALAPQPGTDATAPERSTESTAGPQTTGVPGMPSISPRLPALESIAPVLAPAPLQGPTTQTALPSVTPMPTAPPLPTVSPPTQLTVPTTLPTPSLP
jgi:DNA-binding CsgD family transcriptional regulator